MQSLTHIEQELAKENKRLQGRELDYTSYLSTDWGLTVDF